MALKKTLMIAGAVTSIGLAGAAGGVRAVAAESNDSAGPMSGLISKIAEKFNLKEGDVQAVFDEHKDEMQAEHQANMEERLTKAVADGEITEEQKSVILAKLDELQQEREANRENFQNMTREERREAMKQKRDELKGWAEENNIPEDFFRFLGPGHGQGMHGPAPEEDSSQSES